MISIVAKCCNEPKEDNRNEVWIRNVRVTFHAVQDAASVFCSYYGVLFREKQVTCSREMQSGCENNGKMTAVQTKRVAALVTQEVLTLSSPVTIERMYQTASYIRIVNFLQLHRVAGIAKFG